MVAVLYPRMKGSENNHMFTGTYKYYLYSYFIALLIVALSKHHDVMLEQSEHITFRSDL